MRKHSEQKRVTLTFLLGNHGVTEVRPLERAHHVGIALQPEDDCVTSYGASLFKPHLEEHLVVCGVA